MRQKTKHPVSANIGCFFLKKYEKSIKMKRIVNIFALIFAISAILLTMASCETEQEIVYKDYTVSLTDGLGNPMSEVIVKFINSDGESKTRVTGKDGLAVLKNVVAGNYTVYLEQGFSSAVITNGRFELTADKNELNLVLRDSEKTIDIYGAIEDNSYAYVVSSGSYSIPVACGVDSYFVFNAHKSGIYKISIPSDSSATVGYYGIPMFVQSEHCGEGEYDGKTFELVIQDVGTPYVIGLKSETDEKVSLNIERLSDAPVDPMYAPWTDVSATQASFDKCDFTGKTLVDVDISDSDFEAILGEDGFYYTAGGKPIYIRITTVTSYGSLDENFQFNPVVGGSLAFMAGHVDQNVGVRIGGYVYDDQGNYVGKYSYNEMIKSYMDLADSNYGVVPLTAELADCIKLHGASNGWFNSSNPGYLFDGIVVDNDNTWLFLCMVEQ